MLIDGGSGVGVVVGVGEGAEVGALDGLGVGDAEVPKVLDSKADLVDTPLLQTNFLPLFTQVNLLPL